MKINSRATASSFYTVENKTAYILSLQRMLGIPQSGRLDTQTVKKIVDLKTKYGIVSEYLVDFRVFEMIKCVYKRSLATQVIHDCRPYEYNESFKAINGMLSMLIDYYSLPLRPPRGGVYGYDSIRAISRLRKIYCMDASGGMDGEFIHRLLCDIRSINAMKKQDIDR